MISIMLRGVLIFFILFTGATVSATPLSAAPKYKTKVLYYPVTGSSVAQVHQRMNSPDHSRAYATITQRVGQIKGKMVQGKKRCRVKGFSIPSNYTVRLPKLTGSARLDKKSRARFVSFQKYLRWHEFQHRSIWIGCLRRMEKKARGLRAKTCPVLDAKIAQAFTAEVGRCRRLNARFDQRERKRVNSHIFIKTVRRQLSRPNTANRRRVATTRPASSGRRNKIGGSDR